MYVGTNAGSVGTYELNDGALEVSGILTVGFAGIGEMFQQDGEVDAVKISIGRDEDGDGGYVLNDGIIDSVTFEVGEAGKGSFTQNGGRVNVNSLPGNPAQLIIGQSPTGEGTYRLTDGVLDVDTGTITLGDANDKFEFEGGILRVLTFDGDLTNDGGTLAPAGLTNINGAYLQNSGALGIQIGGYEAGEDFDFINIDGAATLGGFLDVSLIGGFVPEIGDDFTVLTAAAGVETIGLSLIGTAAEMFRLLVNDTSVVLQAISPHPAGDFNNDGTVDAADYVVWRKTGGTLPQYDQWRTNFGRSAAAVGSAISSNEAPVPEPASLLQLAIAAFVFWPLHRRAVRR
jgi:hypothetical protein